MGCWGKKDEYVCLSFILSYTNLQNGLYKTLGMYAGMSAIQGGCGFPILHSVVFKYLSSGQWLGETLPLEEVPDPMVRLILKKVHTFFELNSRKFRYI